MKFRAYTAIWWQLVQREMVVFSHTYKDVLLNAFVMAVFMTLSLGYLLPNMGLASGDRLPLFVGQVVALNFIVGYNAGMMVSFDFESTHLVPYHASLPAPMAVPLLAYVTGAVLQSLCLSVPLLLFGAAGMGALTELHVFSIAGIGFIFLTAVFFSLLFLLAGFVCSFKTYISDIWPRFLSPLFMFGGVLYCYKKLEPYAPQLAMILTLNPVVYCTEGLRGALLYSGDYIPLGRCVLVLSGVSIGLWVLLLYAVKRRLDLVLPRKRI